MLFAHKILLTAVWQIGVTNPDGFNPYLLLGYIVMGVIGVAYVVYLFNRQRNATQDLRVLRQLLEEDETPPR